MNKYNTKHIELKDGQDAYDVIEDYILRYWKHNAYEDVIVSMAISYDGHDYDVLNEIASPDVYCDMVMFLNDWWEGQKFIKLFAIQAVSELKICGGLYEEDE